MRRLAVLGSAASFRGRHDPKHRVKRDFGGDGGGVRGRRHIEVRLGDGDLADVALEHGRGLVRGNSKIVTVSA